MESGTLVQLFENTRKRSVPGAVLVSIENDQNTLCDVPNGTYALVLEADPNLDHQDLIRILWDETVGYVQMEHCLEVC